MPEIMHDTASARPRRFVHFDPAGGDTGIDVSDFVPADADRFERLVLAMHLNTLTDEQLEALVDAAARRDFRAGLDAVLPPPVSPHTAPAAEACGRQ
jgi:hypothetical protein